MNKIKNAAALGAQLIYAAAICCALFALIVMVSLSGNSVSSVLEKSIDLKSVFEFTACFFAASAAVTAAAAYSLKLLKRGE